MSMYYKTSAPIIYVYCHLLISSRSFLSEFFCQHHAQEKINFSAAVGRIWPDSIVLKAPFTGASPHMIGFVLAQLF